MKKWRKSRNDILSFKCRSRIHFFMFISTSTMLFSVPVIHLLRIVSTSSFHIASPVDLQPGNSAVAFSLKNPKTNGGSSRIVIYCSSCIQLPYNYIMHIHVLRYIVHLHTIYMLSMNYQCTTVDGRNPAPVEVGSISHHVQGLFTSHVV